ALTEAARRIEAVHRVQTFHEPPVAVAPGVRVHREWRPFQRVGLYAPGGRTVYPSSVLMMAVPARLAGCPEVVLCCPPQRDGDGTAPPEWLAADLRAQAEHSPDALAMLVTTSESDAAALREVPEGQVKGFRCVDLQQAVAFANDFAPEHLALACRDPERWLSL